MGEMRWIFFKNIYGKGRKLHVFLGELEVQHFPLNRVHTIVEEKK